MTMNNYDQYGWYTSVDTGRAATAEPPDYSETTTPGDCRANWTGRRWVVVPYAAAPEPIETAPIVPESITRWQALTILNQAGMLDAVEEYVGSLPDRQAQIDFTAASIWRRDWPWLGDAATALGLLSEQVDQMFIAASAL